MTPEELALYSHPKMQEKFREKMGPMPFQGDTLLFIDSDIIQTVTNKIYGTEFQVSPGLNGFEWVLLSAYDQMIRLPLPIDPRNPERGLLGMLKRPFSVHFANTCVWIEILDGEGTFEYDPELALLRALAHQEGVAA